MSGGDANGIFVSTSALPCTLFRLFLTDSWHVGVTGFTVYIREPNHHRQIYMESMFLKARLVQGPMEVTQWQFSPGNHI